VPDIPASVTARKELELQQLENLLRDALIVPALSISNLLKEIVGHLIEELHIFQSLEKKMRDGNLTETQLQEHLDSLVALRQRRDADLEDRKQKLTATTTTATTATTAVNTTNSLIQRN
jgi:hypothetical protein